jgi:hypothetical protein
MEPSHYEKELTMQFEYLIGYIKRLKKKNIDDDEREKVRSMLLRFLSRKRKEI